MDGENGGPSTDHYRIKRRLSNRNLFNQRELARGHERRQQTSIQLDRCMNVETKQ